MQTTTRPRPLMYSLWRKLTSVIKLRISTIPYQYDLEKLEYILGLQQFEWKKSRHLWRRYSNLQMASISPPEAVPTPADILELI